MADLVSVSEVKVALRIAAGDSTYDAELTQIIDRVEARLQGDCKRHFKKATYTNEVYDGTGTRYLQTRNYPLRALTAAAIEDEAAITVGDTDQIRYRLGAEAPGLLILGRRYWTKGTNNVTLTYDAGFEVASIKTEAPALWDLILDASCQVWQDMINRRRGVQSQSQMDGSISYFDPIFLLSERFYTLRWKPVVMAYRHVRGIAIEKDEE